MLVSHAEMQTQGRARKLHKNLMGNTEKGEAAKKVATAESCTACSVAAALVSIRHALATIEASALLYAKEKKERILGITDELVEEVTMYSAIFAKSMAVGVRNWAQSDYALSVTGLTGPDGDQTAPNAKVGEVWIGLTDGEETESHYWFYEDAANLYAQAKSIVDEREQEQELDAVRLHIMRVFTDHALALFDDFVTRMRLKEAQQKKEQLC